MADRFSVLRDDLDRGDEELDVDAFVDGGVDLFGQGRHLGLGPAVEDGHFLAVLIAEGGPGGVDGRVPAADDAHPLADRDVLAEVDAPSGTPGNGERLRRLRRECPSIRDLPGARGAEDGLVAVT